MNAMRKNMMVALTALGMATTTMAVQAQDSQAQPQNQQQNQQQNHQYMHDSGMDRRDHRPTPEMMQEKMGQMFAMQQAGIHYQLKLTAAQEPAWNAYQAAIKPTMPAGPRPDMHAFMALPAPERMARMIDMSKEHISKMESHLAALRTFYATLTPVQQKAFDKAAMGHHGHGHHGWGHEGGHGGGHGGEGEHGSWQPH